MSFSLDAHFECTNVERLDGMKFSDDPTLFVIRHNLISAIASKLAFKSFIQGQTTVVALFDEDSRLDLAITLVCLDESCGIGKQTRVSIDYRCCRVSVKPYFARFLSQTYSHLKKEPRCCIALGPKGVGKKSLAAVLAGEKPLVLLKDASRLLEALASLPADSVICLIGLQAHSSSSVHLESFDRIRTLLKANAGKLRVIVAAEKIGMLDQLLELPVVEVDPMDCKARALFVHEMHPQWSEEDVWRVATRTGGFLHRDFGGIEECALVEDAILAIPSIKPSLKHDHRLPTIPNVSWSDIAGIDLIRDRIRRVVEDPLGPRAAAYAAIGLRPPKGILLYGPPGCSKTTIAKAIAASGSFAFFTLSAASLYSCYVGESERIGT